MLPLLIAAGIGLIAGAAAGFGGNVTHNSEHKHIHVHSHKGRGKRRKLSPNQRAKQATTNLYNFAKTNALPPGERQAVHKAIAVVKNKRKNKRKKARSYDYRPYRW
jgi:hypothetical protein